MIRDAGIPQSGFATTKNASIARNAIFDQAVSLPKAIMNAQKKKMIQSRMKRPRPVSAPYQ
jgi:hypothetical protein